MTGEFYITVVSDQPVWLRTEKEELEWRAALAAGTTLGRPSGPAHAIVLHPSPGKPVDAPGPSPAATPEDPATAAAIHEQVAAALAAMSSRQSDLPPPKGDDDDEVDDDSKYRLVPVEGAMGKPSKAGGFMQSEEGKRLKERADRIAAIKKKEDEWRVSTRAAVPCEGQLCVSSKRHGCGVAAGGFRVVHSLCVVAEVAGKMVTRGRCVFTQLPLGWLRCLGALVQARRDEIFRERKKKRPAAVESRVVAKVPPKKAVPATAPTPPQPPPPAPHGPVTAVSVDKYTAVMRQRDDAWKELRDRTFKAKRAAIERDASRRAHIAAVEEQYVMRCRTLWSRARAVRWLRVRCRTPGHTKARDARDRA